MDLIVTVLTADKVLINNDVYKRLKTIDGKYPTEQRQMYMKKWKNDRKERIL
jgi:flagellar biosynthesis regulator FlbT